MIIRLEETASYPDPLTEMPLWTPSEWRGFSEDLAGVVNRALKDLQYKARISNCTLRDPMDLHVTLGSSVDDNNPHHHREQQ